MADQIHAGKRRHIKLIPTDVDGTPRGIDGMPKVSSSAPNMTAVLNTDEADGGATDGSVVDVAHNGLAPGSAPMDVDLMAEADADLTAGVTTITGRMTFTIMAEDVPAPPPASTLTFSAVGDEIDKKP